MKKVWIPIAAFSILCLIIYNSVFAKSDSESSNDSHDYEYYYNEKNTSGDSIMLSKKSEKTIPTTSKAVTMDLKVGSITQLVNKEYGLPSTYIPEDLTVPNVEFNIPYFDEKKQLRKEAADSLEQLFQAAYEEESLSLCGVSGYRSYERQNEIYTKNISLKGSAYTNKYSAKPGTSEHQTGLSIDVSTASVSYCLEEIFAETDEGKWLAQNAHRFGYIIRYPKGKEDITGYSYEPWHIRYVGTELAQHIYDNNLTLEEYYNYTPSKEFLEQEHSYDNIIDESQEIKEPVTTITPVTPRPTLRPTPTPTQKPTQEPEDSAYNNFEEVKENTDSTGSNPEKDKLSVSSKEEETPKKETLPKNTNTPTPSSSKEVLESEVPESVTSEPEIIDNTEEPSSTEAADITLSTPTPSQEPEPLELPDSDTSSNLDSSTSNQQSNTPTPIVDNNSEITQTEPPANTENNSSNLDFTE